MLESPPLNCRRCPAFCCTLAGYVEVSGNDIRRLADHLGLTVPEFEQKHLVTKKRGKRRAQIKRHDETCQFLGADRRCTVYAGRPTDCRGYVCWTQPDATVYEFARMTIEPLTKVRKLEVLEREEHKRALKRARRKSR